MRCRHKSVRHLLVVILGATPAVFGARPLRADAPPGHFMYGHDSVTVSDTKTRLTWQRYVSSVKYSSTEEAAAYCSSASVSSALGGSGWRVPTLRELFSVVDFSRAVSPFLDTAAFPGSPGEAVWTSNVWNYHQQVLLDFGVPNWTFPGSATLYAVRCVR